MGFLDLFTKAVGQKIEEKIVDLAEKKEEQRKKRYSGRNCRKKRIP